ncbi:MAG: 2-amino-4-hydroxy-6-hydroxymethyldihydropteridine diphosphokinase [Dehalococcoidia bacterium]|nr:2-amino-4-hydroxy-6-hydroxymethyldihydropteridine diphosphokinase [Dehalococcoidia bacterium]
MTDVVLALGSNIGDRAGNLRRAMRLLGEQDVAIAQWSSAWETPPMPEDQPRFYNAVVRGETGLSPRGLLEAAKDVERQLGRRPGRRWGPRPIDIDLLFYGETELSEPDLAIPHGGIAERPFVLAPLSELERGPLPVLGERALDLLSRLDIGGMQRAGVVLTPA